jgi:uncharacterized repeat protein (TIGR03917 family)
MTALAPEPDDESGSGPVPPVELTRIRRDGATEHELSLLSSARASDVVNAFVLIPVHAELVDWYGDADITFVFRENRAPR